MILKNIVKSNYYKIVLPIAVGVVIALIPSPAGLERYAWNYFALFAAVIVGLIVEPIPAAAVGFIGVSIASIFLMVEKTPALSIKWALSGFSNSTVWLIFAAFMFAMGYQKTGLGRRLALMLVKKFGGKTLGLGYAVTLSDLLLSPFMPSNTARSGGTIFPVIRNIPSLYGSEPGETSRKIGSYIMFTALAATCVTSSMFLTALAPNLLAIDFIKKIVNIEITWTLWFIGILPIGIVLLLVLPLLIYKIYPPEIKVSKEVPVWASGELRKLGKLTSKEITMGCLALLALSLWIFGQDLVNATTVALITVCLMVVLNVVTWDDVISNKQAWNVLVWFSTLVALADGLSKVGFTKWLGESSTHLFSGLTPVAVMILLVAVFFLTHYIFASSTAHTTAMLPVFLSAGAAVEGMNVLILSLMLSYSLGIMGIITPYATGPSPIYFGSHYISRKDFWVLGLIFGMIFLFLLLAAGTPYLSAIY